MTSRIHIFDHFIHKLGELDNIATTPRSLVLNGYGRCEFSMSTSDPKCNERLLQYGNLIHVEHIPSKDENGNINGRLPDWTGIILPPRDWDFGVIHVNAFSAEAILSFRAMPYISISGTPKTLFKKILDASHAIAKNIVIQPGTIDDLPMTLTDNLRTNGYSHIQKLIKDSGMDWNIEGQINSKGNLELYANLYNRKGIDTPLNLNNVNAELSSPSLTEQGTLSNHVIGHSQAQTDRGRFTKESIDQSSVDDYGSLQLNQDYLGRTDPASVQNASDARVNKRSRPVKIIKRNALDVGGTFNYLNTGNVILVKDTSVGFNPNGGFGFEAYFKIISIDYNDLSNKAPLNLEFVKEF